MITQQWQRIINFSTVFVSIVMVQFTIMTVDLLVARKPHLMSLALLNFKIRSSYQPICINVLTTKGVMEIKLVKKQFFDMYSVD